MLGEDSDLRLPDSRHCTTLKKLTLLRDKNLNWVKKKKNGKEGFLASGDTKQILSERTEKSDIEIFFKYSKVTSGIYHTIRF